MGLWIKRLFIAVMTLIIVVVCAIFVFILSFNAEAYKSDLQLLVKERTDRELTIAGELKIELLPKLVIRARQVSLSEPGSTDRFVLIDDLRASMAIWPLLKNRIIIDELTAAGVQANLVRTSDGKLSIDDLTRWLTDGEAPADMPDVALATDGMTIDVAGIQIKDAAITLRDEKGKVGWEVSNLSFETGRILQDTPVDVKLDAMIRGAGLPSGARVTAKSLIAVDLESRKVNARNIVIVAKGEWPGGAWMSEPLAGLEVVVRSPYTGIELDTALIMVERLSVRAKGQRAGSQLEFSLDVPGFEISPVKLIATSLTSRLRVEGPDVLDVAWVGEDLVGSPQAWTLARLDSTVAIKQASRSMRAFVSGPVQAQMQPLTIAFSQIKGDVRVIPANTKYGEPSLVVKGRLAVAVSDDPQVSQPLSVSGRFESIPFGDAWTGFGIESPLDGVATLDFDLKAANATAATFEDSVTGTVKLNIGKASIRGIDFAEGLDALRAIARPSAEGVQFKGDPARRTVFDNVDVGLRVAGKLADITQLDMSGSNWRVSLGKPAQVNLRDGTANLGVILHMLGPQRITSGKVSVEVRSLVVPLRLTGPLNNPIVNIDWSDLERDRLGKALRQKLLEWDAKLSEGGGKAGARRK